MRPPIWWYRENGWQSRLLAPLGAIYAAGTARRLARGQAYRAGVPVLCVGNLDAGGSGKTPTVMDLVQRLAARRTEAHVVSRGHGGSLKGPIRVLSSHSASDVGDEPLLLSAFGPVWVARDRAAGVRAAEAAGARIVVLDDGFQNPSVFKDFSIVVVDAARGWGNGRSIPAGPLREEVAAGLARADLLLSIGDAKAQADFAARWCHEIEGLPHLRGELRPLQTGMPWGGLRAVAFAGIGQPEKFFTTLRGLGVELVGARALDDHEPLSVPLLQRLAADAARVGAYLITTEKDAARLPAAMRPHVLVLPVRLHLEDPKPIEAALDRLLQVQGSARS